LAQDAWVGVINAAPGYKSEARFRTWLYRIAHNRLVDFWRRRDNQHTDLESAPEPATERHPESAGELTERLMGAIGQLPNEQRDALLLQEQGVSQREIADITRSAEETVKSRFRSARRHLRRQLGGES